MATDHGSTMVGVGPGVQPWEQARFEPGWGTAGHQRTREVSSENIRR